MNHVRYALLGVGFLFATAPGRADDADAKALIEKAVKAHGGQEKLAKFQGHTTKFKGTFHGMGEGIPMTGETNTQGPDRQRVEGEVEAGGQKFKFVIVVGGDKGWTKFGDEVKEMDKDQLAEAKEQAYAGWVATLAPLADKKFTFSVVGEAEVEKKPAVGVKVSSKGHRDTDLYFDKKTGLLVKTETTVKEEGSGKEVIEETLLGGYKDVDGTKQATKITVKRDGKLFMAIEATDQQLSEKLEDSVFAKP